MSMEARLVDNPTSEAGSRGFSVGGILADATLDVRGLWCPLPPLKTIRALGQMKPGEVLEVLGTNPVGNKVAPWAAEKLGNQLLGVVWDREGFYRFYFKKA